MDSKTQALAEYAAKHNAGSTVVPTTTADKITPLTPEQLRGLTLYLATFYVSDGGEAKPFTVLAVDPTSIKPQS